MLEHHRPAARRRPPHRPERRPPRLPAQGMRQRAGRLIEGNQIPRHVKGLNLVLGVFLVAGVTPPADGQIHFPEMLLARPFVVGVHGQYRGRFQVRRVPHHQVVGSIPETPWQCHFCARPAVTLLFHAQVQRPGLVSPGVVRVVQVVHASAVAGNRTHSPVVSAEAQGPGGSELRGARTFDNFERSHHAALRGRHIHRGRRMVARVYQHRGIFPSEVGGGAPGGIRLDGDERLIGPGLHPPRPAARIDHDGLPRPRTMDAARDAVHPFAAALKRGRNLGELDRRRRVLWLRMATAQRHTRRQEH